MPIVTGQAARRRGQAPQSDPHGNHHAAVAVVNQTSNGHPHHGVERREGEAMQQPHQGIADTQRVLDWTDQQGQDLPVHDGENISQQQGAHGIPRTVSAHTQPGLLTEHASIGLLGHGCASLFLFLTEECKHSPLGSGRGASPG
ncbi:hypothetical protein D3C76_1341740 [compost metagenome]